MATFLPIERTILFEWYSASLWHFASGLPTGFQLKINTCILNTKPLSCSYKRFSDCPIHTNVVQECCWIAYSVVKILMNGFCTVMFVYFLHWHSVWRQWLEGNRKWKYIFPFEWWLMHKNAQNCYWMLIKIKKSLWNLIYAQMIVFCRWNITSRNCSSFHANECVFSHNEQQKV